MKLPERCTFYKHCRQCLLPAGHDGDHETRRRRTGPRASTVARKKLTRRVMDEFNPFEYAAELDMQRPRTRGDCLPGGCNEQRPCPWVSCRYSLYLDVNPETGSIKFNHPATAPWQMPADRSCALDVADRGGITLEEVGSITNLTRERIRQLEVRGLLQLKRDGALRDCA